MISKRTTKLNRPIDIGHDHIVGPLDAEMALVVYGSYASRSGKAVHEVIGGLRNQFGDRMCYVFRHFPMDDSEDALRAAELAEYAAVTTGRFWDVHDAIMQCGATFSTVDANRIAEQFRLPLDDDSQSPAWQAARQRVREDIASAQRGGAIVSPTFFINGRRYEGAWDQSALADAMLGSLGHWAQATALDFVRWGPSAGLLLLLMSVISLVLANTSAGPAFHQWWNTPFGFHWGDRVLSLSLLQWVNDGLLTIFFLVVALEIKREFTVGHLATLRSGALPVIAAAGGIIVPALIYVLLSPGVLKYAWGIPISTDTAFVVAIIVMLGNRVPVELRVFLTATVIMDDLVAILVIAVFYSSGLDVGWLIVTAVVIVALVALNRWGIYRAPPYAVLGVILWVCLHESGLHATLAGVIMAMVVPTRPPANLHALMTQAAAVIRLETRHTGDGSTQLGPSEPALRMLDTIHRRIESPADRLLRSVEPWSSYFALPVFALANAGVVLSWGVVHGHERLMAGIFLGLVLGKPIGITAAAALAVVTGVAVKPAAYSWRQMAGAGALAGMGFTMSLFIAAQAFTDPANFAAAKIAIFAASLAAGILGTAILYPARPANAAAGDAPSGE